MESVRIIKIIGVILIVIVVLWLIIHTVFGAGFFERIATIGGIYAVGKPEGYNVVCFVEKHGGAMSCLPLGMIK